jgi:cell division protein FtsZ
VEDIDTVTDIAPGHMGVLVGRGILIKEPVMAKNSKQKSSGEETDRTASAGKADDGGGKLFPWMVEDADLKRDAKKKALNYANIKVVGIGGAGGNAIARMMHTGLQGVEFITINTDAQAIAYNPATLKIQIGAKLTKGLGAGGDPEIGLKAAMESKAEIGEALEGADMIFLTGGMGGGTGSGAAPIIAEIAKEKNALTIAVVTRPFSFEGFKRAKVAEEGITSLRGVLDTLITIPNDKLYEVVAPETTLAESFMIADDILRQGVQGISDLIVIPGMINLDFADVKAIMWEAGSALIGIGQQAGEDRAVNAARQAITSPLLETSIEGARGILINITGPTDLTLAEVKAAADEVYNVSDREANIIFGAVIDDRMKDQVRVTVLATGFDDADEGLEIPIKESRGFIPRTGEIRDTKKEPTELLDEDELDIPAFLRRDRKA